MLESDFAGFGASGRNGGWCSAMFATSSAKLVRRYGNRAEELLRKELEHTVDEVGTVCDEEGIDCHYRKAGRVMLVRSSAQLERARREIEEARSLGINESDLALLGASGGRARRRDIRPGGDLLPPLRIDPSGPAGSRSPSAAERHG